jgi:hypothetical protein
MDERIRTLHPEGKQGVNISKTKYEAVKAAILDALQPVGEATFDDLAANIEERLTGNFAGSIKWYYTTVKLDLEARGVLTRVADARPQRIRLASRG